MDGFEDNPLEKAGLHRKLSPDEIAQLKAWSLTHPELQSQMDEDIRLNGLLRKLDDKPLSSNFTSLVLQAIERETDKPRNTHSYLYQWFAGNRIPRFAIAVAVFCIGLLSYQKYQDSQRAELAHNVAKVVHVTQELTVDVLQNFDAIQRLSSAPVKIDDDLYAALK